MAYWLPDAVAILTESGVTPMRRARRGRDRDLEGRIQREIERRVFEESRRIAEERQRAQDEQVQTEALAEVSDLPRAKVRRISDEVRAEYVTLP